MHINKKIIFSIGTNNDEENNIEKAKLFLMDLFYNIEFSRNLVSKDVLGSDTLYTNCLGVGDSINSEDMVRKALKNIEKRCGCSKAKKSRGIVLVDIDLLYYDDHKVNEEDWERPYVKDLIKEMNLESYI